jgi:acetyl-CoA acetyltransferase
MADRVVIAGIGHTSYGKLPGRSVTSLIIEAARNALADAGVEKSVVDGVFTKSITSDYQSYYSQKLSEAMGLQPRWGGTWDQGGATNISLINVAAYGLLAGQLDVALVCCADNPRSGTRAVYERPLNVLDTPYGWFSVVAQYALIAQRHMQEFGTTSAHLGAIAKACRAHGANNPDAQLRKPITIESHQASEWVVEPLHRDDCCLVSDGAAAVVVMTQARARKLGIDHAVPILGFGHGQTSWNVPLRPTLTTTQAAASGAQAFAEAGIGPRDIGWAQLYDCFTIAPLMTLEDYGFCKKGQGGAFVAGGALEVGGVLPLNTSGGLLSETGMPGMQLVLEGVRQMRDESANQVPGARYGIISNQGGAMHTHATMIVGRP